MVEQEVKLNAVLVSIVLKKREVDLGRKGANSVPIFMLVTMQRLYQVVASCLYRFWVSVLLDTTLPSTRVSVTVITLVFTALLCSTSASLSLKGRALVSRQVRFCSC